MTMQLEWVKMFMLNILGWNSLKINSNQYLVYDRAIRFVELQQM